MPRRRSATLQFNAIRLVGGLLPASLIEQIALQEAPGQKASDYGLPKTLRLQVAVDQAWVTARALRQEAQEFSHRGEVSTVTQKVIDKSNNDHDRFVAETITIEPSSSLMVVAAPHRARYRRGSGRLRLRRHPTPAC